MAAKQDTAGPVSNGDWKDVDDVGAVASNTGAVPVGPDLLGPGAGRSAGHRATDGPAGCGTSAIPGLSGRRPPGHPRRVPPGCAWHIAPVVARPGGGARRGRRPAIGRSWLGGRGTGSG